MTPDEPIPNEPTPNESAPDGPESSAEQDVDTSTPVGPHSNRRDFLTLAAAAGATAIGGVTLWTSSDRTSPEAQPPPSTDAPQTQNASPEAPVIERSLATEQDTAGRTLVVVELQGGNDGLATLVPREAGVLYDQRADVHIPDEELLTFTNEFGWHPKLAGLSGHGVAALLGLGATNEPDGSHFEMERRWWAGKSSGQDLPFTGFFGRLCDELETDQPITGVSLGSNASPALRSDRSVTIGLSDVQAGWFLRNDDDFFKNMRDAMATMAGGVDLAPNLEGSRIVTRMANAREGLGDTLTFGETLAEIDQERINELYPRTDVGGLFGATAELIRQETGIRVIHLTHSGFDTHRDQRGTHDYLLEQLGDAMGIFLTDIAEAGFGDSTLVCTTSEFGRRVSQNDAGTDHGQAGMAMLCGPVNVGVHGEAPSLTNLNDGNLAATVDFEQYYATIAEQWFGVPSSEVLQSAAAPIDGLLDI